MRRRSNLRRVFLSYSSKDREEVQRLHVELRRRGVPVWFDAVDLPRGRVTETELERASREAAGFAFYLTEHAARSEWVREHERRHALSNQGEDASFGIFPIFRDDRARVTELMQQTAADPSDLAIYDLSPFHGLVLEEILESSGLEEALRQAAAGVLRSLLGTLAERRPPDTTLRIGAATRGGPKLAEHPLDLVVDWTQDFPGDQGAGGYPGPEECQNLLRALQDLRRSILEEWRGRTLKIVPQCHLSPALALGFLFRRNSGFALEVVHPHSQAVWQGPHQPLSGTPDFWSVSDESPARGGGPSGLVVVLAVSRPLQEQAWQAVFGGREASPPALRFEPASGPGLDSMAHLAGDAAHRAAMAVIDRIAGVRARGVSGPMHLFYAGPAPFAVLFAQHLSNLGAVQLYEWTDSEGRFVPVFLLRSS